MVSGMDKEQHKRIKLARRELLHVAAQEKKLREAAVKGKPNTWKKGLERLIPVKVYDGLVNSFSTGFSLVFRQGRKIIEKTYDKQSIQNRHQDRDAGIRQGQGRGELKQMRKSVSRSNGLNMTATTAEGIALGILGVGLPDIVLFLSTLLKGIYETALHYGFGYESRQEQYLILSMMAAALTSGPAWDEANAEVDSLLTEEQITVTEEVLDRQSKETASIFAMDMLLLKFIQGMPVVGLIGGAANPVYYHKVMQYVQLKYRKRYLLKQLSKEETR